MTHSSTRKYRLLDSPQTLIHLTFPSLVSDIIYHLFSSLLFSSFVVSSRLEASDLLLVRRAASLHTLSYTGLKDRFASHILLPDVNLVAGAHAAAPYFEIIYNLFII